MKRNLFKKGICLLLSMTFLSTSVVPALANTLKEENLQGIEYKNTTIELNQEKLEALINELNNTEFNNNVNNDRGVASKLIKNAAKWMKSNLSKLVDIMKKYTSINISTKGVISFLDDIIDGVASIDESLDELVYNVVDLLAPNLSSNNKRVITNAIRIILPF